MTSKRGLCRVFMSHRSAQNTDLGNAPSNHIVLKGLPIILLWPHDWSKMDIKADADGACVTCTWGTECAPALIMLPEQPATNEGQEFVHKYSSILTHR